MIILRAMQRNSTNSQHVGLDIFKTKFDDLIHVAASDSVVRVKESEKWSLLCI